MTTIKQHILDTYEMDTIQDIVNHGCVSGCATDLIYYADTNAFHDKFEEEIWDMLYQDSDNQGVTIMELIASFNGQKHVGSMAQFKNLLSWYAVERVCFDIINNEEEEEQQA